MIGTHYVDTALSASPGDPDCRAAAVCDVDMDDAPDIVLQHNLAGTVAAWSFERETFR
jgi:hypothetical protein